MNFSESDVALERALQVIPNGTCTFSKSRTMLPVGHSPFYADRGFGGHLWDIDDNEFLDLTMGLTAVTLGYRHKRVDQAVMAQVKRGGAIFSLPQNLEITVAERIIDMVPCAEMVRFGKNGSDVTAGAVRLARYVTGRNMVLCCGYHGWQDWYIGTTGRNGGVPAAVSELTKQFRYNDILHLTTLLEKYEGQVACVIMEPMNRVFPVPGFLQSVQNLCKKHGVIFILDEVITGFRFANGGAQEYFDIVPDMCTLGKGIANGYPLSAVCGKRELMEEFSKIHFSFTYASDSIALTAANTTLLEYKYGDVCEKLAERGEKLKTELNKSIRDIGITHLISSVSGHPAWSHFNFKDDVVKSEFLKQVHSLGILTAGTNNLCYMHTDADIDYALCMYEIAFERLASLDWTKADCLVERGVR